MSIIFPILKPTHHKHTLQYVTIRHEHQVELYYNTHKHKLQSVTIRHEQIAVLLFKQTDFQNAIAEAIKKMQQLSLNISFLFLFFYQKLH